MFPPGWQTFGHCVSITGTEVVQVLEATHGVQETAQTRKKTVENRFKDSGGFWSTAYESLQMIIIPNQNDGSKTQFKCANVLHILLYAWDLVTLLKK